MYCVYFGFYKERTIIFKTKKKKISVNVLFHLSTLLRCSVACSIGSCFKSYLLQNRFQSHLFLQNGYASLHPTPSLNKLVTVAAHNITALHEISVDDYPNNIIDKNKGSYPHPHFVEDIASTPWLQPWAVY
ncbi:hypothetical protein P5673_001491 [Acropora cervicornis]|uniref:Uncharacterized protein n=1 Tax=Acropora cervicornis TaxID=6130 RepID=A0AAD9R683_ACRCE|nr:hypothetical protein P5673_001491 [Acropora cervicornis]